MNKRVQKLQQGLSENKIDAMLVERLDNVRYLSGFTGTNAKLLVTAEKLYLYTDFRYIDQAKEQCPGAEIIKVIQLGNDIFEKIMATAKQWGINRLGFETDYVTHENYQNMVQYLPETELIPVKGITEGIRMVKDQEELRLLEHAVALADRAWAEVLPHVKPGITEKQFALELEIIMRRLGAERPAFNIIVASGPRGALPHGVASDRVINTGDMVTVDFGAVYKGYHSDITRNFVLGSPSAKQQEIYKIVLEAQVSGINAVKPGVAASAVDAAARGVIERYGYADYFGHGTGHGVGLVIHEGPRLSPQDNTELQPGMVVTVEPGIYLPGWGGVRIEDILLVTEDGARILTKTPKEELLVI
ncbi:M24 family metallopeptidase [Desulfofalx alkaliphila]|uniref:M24 family metallopeptidase n=1 Tax=Desulfofalx alkaliphila TaxID=105483 RepID=UPI0004E18DE8|nr:Xaa-Pro peptidase family protein [Desulfofalx alkaliphila]